MRWPAEFEIASATELCVIDTASALNTEASIVGPGWDSQKWRSELGTRLGTPGDRWGHPGVIFLHLKNQERLGGKLSNGVWEERRKDTSVAYQYAIFLECSTDSSR